MAEIRYPRVEQGGTKIRNVPIAVTPEGFWCCPSPVVFQKTLKAQSHVNKAKQHPSSPPPQPPTTKTSSAHKKQSSPNEKKSAELKIQSKPIKSDDQNDSNPVDSPNSDPSPPVSERAPKPKAESSPRKVSIEFGEPGTSNLKVVLLGKHGFSVKLNVHKEVLVENSSFFAKKLSQEQYCSDTPCLEIDDCDVEIYVETVGLMYCKDMKLRLIKQSVQRVLRILKAAEFIGFSSCIRSCLDYLEAVPWVGEEEEDKVVSSVLNLQSEGISVDKILKRVSSNAICPPPKDTLSHIIELVLKSTEERSRREMKAIVLKLLKENTSPITTATSSSSLGSMDSPPRPSLCYGTIYSCCKSSFESLLLKFKEASSEPDLMERPSHVREPLMKQIALESDNLLWLLEILADRRAGDEFVGLWANQLELASLHPNLPIIVRHHVSCVTARLFVGIGRGEMLPTKQTRHMLLQTWLEPLINDYNWLNHGCRSFDRTVVEEGIGRTILTLPLEDQQRTLLDWFGRFLKSGDSCPDLRRAFEVWWRRAFIKPHGDQLRGSQGRLDKLMALEGVE